ncbi:MAG: EamA/RhaT family transporter [Deltaproteobacteria bacterium]|nr:MAG: EamA/RhaT family transporter [Deltaproteobacteria bacterium]
MIMDKQKLLTWPPVVIFLALCCALLWGSAFPMVKIGFKMLQVEQSTGGKLYFAAYRFLLAGLMIFGALFASGTSILLPSKRDYALLLLLGLLQTTLQYIFFYIGLSNTTGMKASIINGAGSFFLALSSHLWIKDDVLTTRKNLGLILGFLGIVLVNLKQRQFDFEFHLTGEGFIFFTALASTCGMLLVKKNSLRIHPPLLSAYQLTFGALVLLGIARVLEPPGALHFTSAAFLLLLYLGFVSAAAFSLWYVLVKYNQLTSIAVYRFLIPVSGTFLSAAVLAEEHLTWIALLSLALVSLGMILTSWR